MGSLTARALGQQYGWTLRTVTCFIHCRQIWLPFLDGIPTYREAVALVYVEQRKAWKNKSYNAQWISSLEACLPSHRRQGGKPD